MFPAPIGPRLQGERTTGLRKVWLKKEVKVCIAPCECTECSQQFRTKQSQLDAFNVNGYTEVLFDDDQDNKLSSDFLRINTAQKVLEVYSYLKNKIHVHGDEIMRAWESKTDNEREAVLLKVNPNMYPHSWGEIRLLWKLRNEESSEGVRAFHDFSTAPYINLQALKEDPARLLSLLFNRVRFSPQEWATYDNYKLRYPWEIGALNVVFSPLWVLMHGKKYGTLFMWNAQRAHSWEWVGFPRAHLVISTQLYVLDFLKKIVDILISRVRGDFLGSVKWNETWSSGFGKKGATHGIFSGYLNQPYNAPPMFNIDTLISIAGARMNETADHLWLLQTDPAYFRHIIENFSKGRIAAQSSTYRRNLITARDLIHDVYTCWTWKWVVEECKNFKALQLQFSGQIRWGQPLPQEYDKALGGLEGLVIYLMNQRSQTIEISLPQSPGFSDGFKMTHNTKLSIWKVRQKEAYAYRDPMKDPLDWVLNHLCGEPDKPRHLDRSMLFGFLEEHLASCSAKERNRLDERLYYRLSDYAAFHEMLVIIRQHRPRWIKRDIGDMRCSETRKAWRYINKGFFEYTTQKRIPGITDEKTALSGAIGTFMKTPLVSASGKRDREWLKRDEESRKSLSAFWTIVRDEHTKTLKHLNNTRDGASFTKADFWSDLKDLLADCDPAHRHVLQKERDEVMARIAAAEAISNAKKVRKEFLKSQREQSRPEKIKRPDIQVFPVSDQPHLQKSNKTSTSEDQIADTNEAKISNVAIGPRKTSLVPQKENARLDSVTKHKFSKQLIAIRKPKSAPSPNAAGLHTKQLPATIPEPASEQPLPVKKDTLEVISNMFPTSGETYLSINWSAFVLAMSHLGFPSRNIGGSAVLFEPTQGSRWFSKGKIVFHRPHPSSSVDPVIVSAMAKRMNKWFGWERESFCLAG